MNSAYRRIFRRCGLDAISVDADPGLIGGSGFPEFVALDDAGRTLSSDAIVAAMVRTSMSRPACPHLPMVVRSKMIVSRYKCIRRTPSITAGFT